MSATAVIDGNQFSALRLEVVFPKFASMFLPDKSGGEWNAYGGLWEVDQIEGVQFGFPQVDPAKLGFIQLDHSTGDDTEDFYPPGESPYPVWPQTNQTPVKDARKKHSMKVLKLLQFPLQFGAAAKEFSSVFSGVEVIDEHRDEKQGSNVFDFFLDKPTRYLCAAYFSDRIGLKALDIVRDDLRLANMRLYESMQGEED